ncbi:MAG TPA: thioredoxin domain-containing protein [Myxococcaceae bacterium]|nr:thioredoxin domain-containing protein [Myxococcaceae bacterium]
MLPHSGALRWSCLVLAATALACATPKQVASPSAEAPASEAPAAEKPFDPAEGLDAETREALQALLDDELCPCGCPHELGTCLREHDCVHARRAASLLSRMLARGMPGEDALYQLSRYYQGFEESRLHLSPPEGQCRGPEDADVTLVIFADFECPTCKATAPLFDRVATSEAAHLRTCAMSFPLPMHPNAGIAAQAALFARDQGAFFPLHDAILAHRGTLDLQTLLTLAEGVGLDRAALQQALDEGRYRDEVEAQRRAGQEAGVSATPSYLINGRLIHLPLGEENLRQAVVEEREWAAHGGAFAPHPEVR